MKPFLYLLILGVASTAIADSTQPLLQEVIEDSITVIDNPKRVIFEELVVFPEINLTTRKEINCKNHTIFIHEIQAAKHFQKPVLINNESEPARILLKTDKHYDLYKKYCK